MKIKKWMKNEDKALERAQKTMDSDVVIQDLAKAVSFLSDTVDGLAKASLEQVGLFTKEKDIFTKENQHLLIQLYNVNAFLRKGMAISAQAAMTTLEAKTKLYEESLSDEEKKIRSEGYTKLSKITLELLTKVHKLDPKDIGNVPDDTKADD